jgi:hypothetical protein
MPKGFFVRMAASLFMFITEGRGYAILVAFVKPSEVGGEKNGIRVGSWEIESIPIEAFPACSSISIPKRSFAPTSSPLDCK